MSAWQYLLRKGVGPTAFAVLVSGVVAAGAWDALVQKSSAPEGSTAWVHLISVLDQTPAPEVTGGGFESHAEKQRRLALDEDNEAIRVIMAFLESI